jgi:hypothetical protein
MAKNQNRRLKPSVIEEDEAAFNALKKIAGYAPANPAYSIEAIGQAIQEKRTAQADEDQEAAALATKRDVATDKEWTVHNLILGGKDSVRAQFGKDSTQVQELGLKRVSEYKTRRPKSKPSPGQ